MVRASRPALAGLAALAGIVALVVAAPERDRAQPTHPPRVVSVAERGATDAEDTATGFAVGPERVVTVAHVIESRRTLLVRTPSGSVRARVVRLDRRDDLALLAVPGLAATRVRIRTGVVGKARLLLPRRGLAATITRHVTATMRSPDAPAYVRPALELRAPVALGDSGAPLVDRSGAVAGVLFARSTDARATAWAVDATALAQFLRRA